MSSLLLDDYNYDADSDAVGRDIGMIEDDVFHVGDSDAKGRSVPDPAINDTSYDSWDRSLKARYPELVTQDSNTMSSIANFLKSAGSDALDKLKGAYTKTVNGKQETDWKAIAATAGGLYGLYQSNQQQQPSGYQGKIPKLEAVREQVANTYDPTRRPGSSNQTYFTDTKYVAPADAAAARATAKTEAAGLGALKKEYNPLTGSYTYPGEKPTAEYNRQNRSTAIPDYLINEEYPDSLVEPQRPAKQGNLMGILAGGGAKSRGNPNYLDAPFMPVMGGERTFTPEEIAQQQQELVGKITANMGQPPAAMNNESAMQAAEAAAKAAAQPQAMAAGGIASMAKGRYLRGATDGMADKIPARIGKTQEARLSDGEFVVPADVVGHLGNGNSEAGAKRLYEMMDRIRQARTGNSKQGKQVNPNKFLPA